MSSRRMLHNGSALAFQANGAGSIPVIRSDGPLAQLVRAPPCHGGGRQFKSDTDRLSPSSSGLGHRPFTAVTRVQTPLETQAPIAQR